MTGTPVDWEAVVLLAGICSCLQLARRFSSELLRNLTLLAFDTFSELLTVKDGHIKIPVIWIICWLVILILASVISPAWWWLRMMAQKWALFVGCNMQSLDNYLYFVWLCPLLITVSTLSYTGCVVCWGRMSHLIPVYMCDPPVITCRCAVICSLTFFGLCGASSCLFCALWGYVLCCNLRSGVRSY